MRKLAIVLLPLLLLALVIGVVGCDGKGTSTATPTATPPLTVTPTPTPTLSLTPTPTPTPTSWISRGPYGGYVSCMAMAQTNPDIIFAGTEAGLFKTIDGGLTWSKTGFPETLARVVQVAPANPDIVYVGTDDGIYESEDGGSTWIQKGLLGARVNAIAIDSLNPHVLYAGTGEPEVSYSGEIVGIFKSMDAGETWQEKLSKGLDAVTALLIDVDNSLHIYAGVYGDNDGLRKSTDGGETWVSKRVNPDYYPRNENLDALAMTPAGSSPPVIYALGTGRRDVFKSQDKGESWIPTHTPSISPNPPWALAVDPNRPDIVYVSTHYKDGGFYRSTDSGSTWLIKAKGLPASVPSSIVIDPRNSTVYVGLSEAGVYRSTDGAESWNFSSQGMNNTSIEGLAIHPFSSDTVFAAIKGIGLAKTTTGGTSWDYLTGLPAYLGAIAIDPRDASTIWVGDGYHRDNYFYIYKSGDGGQSWTSIEFLYVYGRTWTGISDIFINPDDSEDILVGTTGPDGILGRTTDGGKTWKQLGGSTTALATDPNDPNVVYSGKTQIGEVFQYSNVWGDWRIREITPLEGIGGVRDIEVDSDSRVYVAASDGLWRWDDSGWTKFTGLPTDDICALAIDSSIRPEVVYAGTGGEGVFISQDGGVTWIPFNEGLGSLPITKLAISARQPKTLFAGTAYGGLWSCNP